MLTLQTVQTALCCILSGSPLFVKLSVYVFHVYKGLIKQHHLLIPQMFLIMPHISPVENQNDLELDFKVFFFVDYCCVGIVLDESN